MDTEADNQIEYIEEDQPAPKGPFARYWEKMGGGSFTISLIIHIAFVLIAIFLIFFQYKNVLEKPDPDFLSGGGGGTEGNTQVNKQKQKMMMNRAPAVKLSSAAQSNISIPNTTSTLTTSTFAVTSGQMSGTPGSGGGIGGGIGRGHGKGIGDGWGPGKGAGFVANFMGTASTGSNIIFCIDTSGSMRVNLSPQGIQTLRTELEKVIRSLPPTISFNLICFGTNGDIFKKKSVLATQENKSEAFAFLAGYYGGSGDFGRTRTERYGRAGKDGSGIEYVPLESDDIEELKGTEGGSRIDLAMVAAFERAPSTIYVLSDGAPGTKDPKSNSPMDKDDIIKLIHKKFGEIMGSNAKITLNTITIESDTEEGREGEQFMGKLARKFGGKYKKVDIRKVKAGGGDKPDDKADKDDKK